MIDLTESPRPRMPWVVTAVVALLLTGLALLSLAQAPAEAAKSGTCEAFTAYNSADRVVSADDQVFRPGAKTTVSPRGFVLVRGQYAAFDVRLSNFEVLNYRLNSPLTGGVPAEIFVRKTPKVSSPLSGALSVELPNEGLRLQRGTGQNFKVQAKDCEQGGLFQHEPEPGVTYEHVLGQGFKYNGPVGTGRLCFTNGQFSGYESPELATRLAPQDGQGTSSTWRVPAGGRMGMVVGEDAVEGGCRP